MPSTSFRWVIPNCLAGCPMPGLLAPFEVDVAFLKRQGIRLLVNLMESPLEPSVSADDFRCLHFPIDDMGIPTPRAAAELCRTVIESMKGGEPVAFHCKAGLGRTGTMLACCLVTLGSSPEEAITKIRYVNTYYIQTADQERFVHDYAEFLRPSETSPAHLGSDAASLPKLKLRFPAG